MSLWTPYAAPEADAPLDLSRVKQEPRESPEAGSTAPQIGVAGPPLDGYHYPQQHHPMPPQPISPMPCYQYIYPPPYTYPPYTVPAVSSIQISPVSVESSRSGCELDSPPQAVPVYRPPALSPPESLPMRPLISEAELSDDPDFQQFEQSAMRAMAEKNGGTLLGHNPRMRRVVQTTQAVDDSYRKQRERNNFAAKQSRDRRKLREVHLALKVTYLKTQNDKLRAQIKTGICRNCKNILHEY